MSITILRGRYKSFSFDTIDEAVASLRRHDRLILSDEVIEEPIVIPVRNVTLFNDGPTVGVIVAAGVSKFYVGDGANVVVRVESSDTTVFGADAEAFFVGGETDNDYVGGIGDEVILGGGGDDRLSGGAGDDILVSDGIGRTWLRGDDGNDLLVARSGLTLMEGGAGEDVFEVHVDADQRAIIDDFGDRDRLEIVGFGSFGSLDEVVAAGGEVRENAKGDAMIRIGDARIDLRGVSLEALQSSTVVFTNEGRPLPTDPLAPTPDPEPDPGPRPAPGPDTIMFGNVAYHLRETEPEHENFKFQDKNGYWYSPDYFVLVAGGQSNMQGSSKSGAYILNDDIMAYDWFNDRVIKADYGEFPATLVEGQAPRNNLYFPMAVELTEEFQRPVLVVNRAYPGSKIDSWLESGAGDNWALMQDSVAKALAHVGQSAADAFIWLQGESDFSVPTDRFVELVREFIGQVRAQDWAGPSLDILMGELSREGTNFVQNAALQILEVERSDPNLGFVSSVGLSSDDRDGVHFNGPSLEEYGQRYAQALFDLQNGVVPAPNSAPQPTVSGTVGRLTVAEGQELSVDVSAYFADAEGDDLFYYSYLSKRSESMTFEDQDADSIVLRPDYTSAGDYTVYVYATDGELDGDTITFDLTVTEATPLVTAYSNSTFDLQLYSYRDFATAMDEMSTNRALDVLNGAAFGSGPVTLDIESLHIRGGSSVAMEFLLDTQTARVSLYGNAAFDVRGNGLDNRIIGNNGDNRLTGYDGDDQLNGGGGRDVLVGGGGDDRLNGGSGDDILQGGGGNDRMTGGQGSDRFHFADGQGSLVIDDYETIDRIEVRNFASISNYNQLIASADAIYDDSGRAILDFGDQRLTLIDVSTADLSSDMFVFI